MVVFLREQDKAQRSALQSVVKQVAIGQARHSRRAGKTARICGLQLRVGRRLPDVEAVGGKYVR